MCQCSLKEAGPHWESVMSTIWKAGVLAVWLCGSNCSWCPSAFLSLLWFSYSILLLCEISLVVFKNYPFHRSRKDRAGPWAVLVAFNRWAVALGAMCWGNPLTGKKITIEEESHISGSLRCSFYVYVWVGERWWFFRVNLLKAPGSI